MAVNYTDVQKTEKYISRTNFDALEMAAVPEGTEFNIVDQIHESDLDSDVLQKLNNNAKINTENTFTAAQTFKNNITIEGNIIQKGKAYETHAEKLYTKNDMIYTRDGAGVGDALADNAYTGIQAVKYDGTNDGQLVFGKDGVARVGDVGHTQPLATRAEKDALTDGHILQWDAAGQTLVDSGKSVSDLEGGGGDVTAAGNNTFTGSNWFKGNGAILTTQNGIRIGFSNGVSPDADSSIYSIDKYGFQGLGENGSLQTIKFPDLSTFSTATHTIPLSDTNNTFTGNNTFSGTNTFEAKESNPITISYDNDTFISLNGRKLEIFDALSDEQNKKKYDTTYRSNFIMYRVIDYSGEQPKVNLTKLLFPEKEGTNAFTLATTDDISNASYFNNEILFMSPVQFTQGIKDSASGSIISLPGKGGTFALIEDTKHYHHHIVIKSTTGTITESSGIYLNADLYSKSNEEMTISALITYFQANPKVTARGLCEGKQIGELGIYSLSGITYLGVYDQIGGTLFFASSSSNITITDDVMEI